jgi:hypothetical protein
MPSTQQPDQDEDLQLAIALSRSLGMVARDDADLANPGSQSSGGGKLPDSALLEEDEEQRASEQLHAFLAEASRLLRAEAATEEDLHALLPPLSDFAAGCTASALSLRQRAFAIELVELWATRQLHGGALPLPSDVPSVLLASKRFLECTLCALEHASTDALAGSAPPRHRALAISTARRSLAAVLALTAEGEAEAEALAAAVRAQRRARGPDGEGVKATATA